MKDYCIIEAESREGLEERVQARLEMDASWQPLGGAFVRDRVWFQALYRRPYWGRRLGLFLGRVWRGVRRG